MLHICQIEYTRQQPGLRRMSPQADGEYEVRIANLRMCFVLS